MAKPSVDPADDVSRSREPGVATVHTFADEADRSITVRSYTRSDFDALVEMYADFDPGERAQGLPPLTEYQIETWLDSLVATGPDLLACHDDRPIGHASLVPDGDRHELVIFVVAAYQGAGIGSRLLRTLLERGRTAGVERVWLTVERRNVAALNLYRSAGFEVVDADGRAGSKTGVLRMTRSLTD